MRPREIAVITLIVISTALWVASALPRLSLKTARRAPQTPTAVVTIQPRAPSPARPDAGGVQAPAGVAVNFGEFADRPEALQQARLIRSKGYLASVVRTGSGYRVISRAYMDHYEAAFWAGIFQQIGIPGSPHSLQ